MYIYFYNTVIGKIAIVENNNYIVSILFENQKIPTTASMMETPLIKKTYQEINDYLNEKLIKFNIPINLHGSEFMLSVWNELKKIPYGLTVSYQDIAIKINKPSSARAVGQANNKNPLPIIIPCHRVVGKNKKLVGYAGGIAIKEKLLDIEKKYKNDR